MLRAEISGRQRLYRIAKPEVAYALEALGTIATASPVRNIVRDPWVDALRTARSCYDHLAGRLAVEMRQKLESSNLIRARGNRQYELAPRGEAWLAKLGVNVEQFEHRPRLRASVLTGPSAPRTWRARWVQRCCRDFSRWDGLRAAQKHARCASRNGARANSTLDLASRSRHNCRCDKRG